MRRHALTVPQTNALFVRPAGFTGTSYTIDYNFIDDLPRNDSMGHAQELAGHARRAHQAAARLAARGAVRLRRDARRLQSATTARTTRRSTPRWPAAIRPRPSIPMACTALRSRVLGLHRATRSSSRPPTATSRATSCALNGTLFELPGGELALATGFERQEIDVALGSARGGPTTPLAWRYFGRNVNSAYAELQVPFVGAAQRACRRASPDAECRRALRRLQRRGQHHQREVRRHLGARSTAWRSAPATAPRSARR